MPAKSQPRLHKYLADLGLASRREIERWIADGRVTVDGKTAGIGDKLREKKGRIPRIAIDGKALPAAITDTRMQKTPRVIIYNKPEGEICTRNDPRGRATVFAKLPKLTRGRWVAVGRLDINTRGLLLFTDDGALANRLMHPSGGCEREYLCRVYGEVDAAALRKLQSGVELDGVAVRFLRVKRCAGGADKRAADARNAWYSAVVGEGKYREVRRMWGAVGGRLSRLMRVRYGDVKLPRGMAAGSWREMKAAEVKKLMRF